jgi:hypothetical protein
MLIGIRWLRVVCVVLFYGFLVYAGQIVGDFALSHLEMDLRPAHQAMIHRIVMATAALYVLLLAMPFMPGVEIGLGLMILLGPDICLLVYLTTLVALVLSFLVGRLVPISWIIAMLDWLGLARARAMVSQFLLLPDSERMGFLLARVPAHFLSFLLRHRYLALAVMFNLPGNAFIGGGGGIALTAGISRVFSLPYFVLTIALSVAPVPLVFYLFDGFR